MQFYHDIIIQLNRLFLDGLWEIKDYKNKVQCTRMHAQFNSLQVSVSYNF